MALWAKVQQCLHGEMMKQLQSVYGAHFPIDIRHTFAEWIEAQPWFNLQDDNQEHERVAAKLVDELVQMIENRANALNSEDMFIDKLRLQETGQQFQQMYGSNPFNLVRVVKQCLETENFQVQRAEMAGGNTEQANAHRYINQQLELLQRQTQATETDLRQLQEKQEALIIRYQENVKLDAVIQREIANQPNQPQVVDRLQQIRARQQTLQAEISNSANELLRMRMAAATRYTETCQQLSVLQSRVLDEQLIGWKRQQQLSGNGAQFEGSLETLQKWCESLAELVWQNRIQIKRLEALQIGLPLNYPPGTDDPLPQLNSSITGLLSALVTSTFIIEKQPPQVLKKDSKFGATIRLMVGGKLNVHMNPPAVKASIISEEQARCLLRNERDVRSESSGDILNGVGTMEYNQASGQLSVAFRNMTLKRIKRAEKKGNEIVTEEKFSILFQSQFKVGGGELDFQVWTLSLPVVVTVHGNQECNALATVLWDNAFAESGRTPFHVPDRVPWPQLAQALNTKFESCCGVGLTTQHLNYLASKVFCQQLEDYTNCTITWAQFNREPLQMRNFTFWEYFYSIFKLTKDWLHACWKDRLIHGFLSKQEAQDMLMRRPNGTFLLRFSDSELGGITIAWVADDGNPSEKQVWNLAPFTDKDFRIQSLGDKIKDLKDMTYLYPDIPKQTAFGKFWQPSQEPTIPGGYVKPKLVTVINEGTSSAHIQSAAPLNCDNPQTPQMPMESPSTPPLGTKVEGAVNGSQLSELDDLDYMFDAVSGVECNAEFDYDPNDIQQMGINHLLNFTPQANSTFQSMN